MRVVFGLLLCMFSAAVSAADGAWVAFFRDGNHSVAFERASVMGASVKLLSVSPKNTVNGIVVSWDIKTQVHEFNCAAKTYRMITKVAHDTSGRTVSDSTATVSAMNAAFPDRMHPLDTEALRKAHALVCGKSEPAPAKPFSTMTDALAWMAN